MFLDVSLGIHPWAVIFGDQLAFPQHLQRHLHNSGISRSAVIYHKKYTLSSYILCDHLKLIQLWDFRNYCDRLISKKTTPVYSVWSSATIQIIVSSKILQITSNRAG